MTGHGGNIYQAAKRTGIPVQRIIDFSASINPLGVPASAAAAMKNNISRLPHYPEPFAENLIVQIGKHYHVNPGSVVCGNGSTELIYLLPRALRPKKVLVTAPTFSEYEKACRVSNKSKVKSYVLKKEDNFDINPREFIAHMKGATDSEIKCDMAFLCNPNNPTGRLLGKSEVLKIADAARKLKCYLVVDEAFIDFCSKASVIREVEENPYLIVLRSMTKFYALSGLRIGFGVFPQSITILLKNYKEPWTVNSLAQEAGRAALSDTAYRKATLGMMKEEKKFMEKHFERMSVYYIPSKANYYLLRIGNAQCMIPALEQKGILVRDCSNFNGLDDTYLRIAVRSRRENEILIRELSALCQA